MSHSVKPPLTDEELAAAQRARARSSIFLAGKVSFEGVRDTYDCRIRNLSATGMMAECKAHVHQGQAAVVETKGIGKINGKVAWAVDGRIGIAFEETIDPELARNPGRANASPEVAVPDYLKDIRAPKPGIRRL